MHCTAVLYHCIVYSCIVTLLRCIVSAYATVLYCVFILYTAVLRISGALEQSTEVMASMQQLLKVEDISATMRELSQEMMKVCTSSGLIKKPALSWNSNEQDSKTHYTMGCQIGKPFPKFMDRTHCGINHLMGLLESSSIT